MLLASSATAQQRDNIYRYILDVDVPAAAAFVTLDIAEAKVLRGSAPKPIMGSVVYRSNSPGPMTVGAAVDIVPYYFLGGGARTLESYRSNSIAGRLLRVVTKTALSVGLSQDRSDGSGLLGALALRTTFHDPHDPVLNSLLPEQVDSALAAHGIHEEDATVEHLGDRGVDLEPIFSAARRQMRAQGDVQISAGWGMATQLKSGSLSRDSSGTTRHTLWLTGQHALGHRLDVLATAQFRSVFRADGRMRLGMALQRKARWADFRVEVYYDWASRRFHPGVLAEARVVPGVSAVVSLTSEAPVGNSRGTSQARATLLIRWYAASSG